MVDADEKVLRGLERLLGEEGLVVTGTTDPVRARDLVVNKYFAVALCDIDTPAPGEGVRLVGFIRQESSATTVLVMTPRKSYEVAVQAFRAGAADVVLKQTDQVGYLRERVGAAAGEIRVSAERGRLLEDVAEIHESFLRRMMDQSKQLVDLEDRVLGRGDASRDTGQVEFMDVLMVDDDPALHMAIQQSLPQEKGWRLRLALTGGEALDIATQGKLDIALVKELLPDLPGTMVLKTVKASSPDAICLLYVPPGARSGRPGEVKMVDASRILQLIPQFSSPEQLVASLTELREVFRKKARERRYLQAFRQQQFEFLKRYNEVKQRVARALGREDPKISPNSGLFRR